jgi:uncharacterized repeat protein (TIGR03803 family)
MTPGGTLTNLYLFSGNDDGGFIYAGLVQGSDGNFYGAAFNGGTSGYGSLFRVDANGAFTNLHSFNGFDGGFPYSGLTQGSDGNIYGTTYQYGAFNAGTIFKLTPSGAFTNLFTFNGANGSQPGGVLVQGADGNFYGTTSQNGANGYGTIFRLSVPLPPVIQSVTLTNGTITFTWSAVAGQTYQVESKSDLTRINWRFLGGSFVATNGIMTTTDSIDSTSQLFYRVVLLP